MSINGEMVKDAWRQYGELAALAYVSLADMAICATLRWKGDTGANVGYSVRAVLMWAVERLGASSGKTKPENAKILSNRFVFGYSIAESADLHNKDAEYIKRRTRTAWNQTAKILAKECVEMRDAETRKTWICEERFEILGKRGKKLLKFMAVFDRPISPNYLIYHENQLPQMLDANVVQRDAEQFVQVHPRIVDYVRDLLTREERKKFHTQAGELYAEEGRVLLAAMQWQAAGKWQAAADILINNRHKLGDIDTPHTLDQWQTVLQRFTVHQFNDDDERWAQLKLMLGNVAKMTKAPLPIALEAYRQAFLAATTTATQAEIYYERGHALQEHDVQRAILYLKTCCELNGDLHVDYWAIRSQILLAWIYRAQRDEWVRWIALAEQGLVNKVGVRWDGLRADWHNTWSEYYKYMGDFANMLQPCERAVIMAERSRDPLRIVKMTYQLGAAYHQNNSAERAREMLEQCEKWATQMGYDVMIGKIQNIWGATSFERQAYDEALQHYQQAEKAFHDAGEKRSYAATQYNQAEVLFASGNAMQALEMMNNGQKIAQASGNQTLSDWFEPRLRKMYVESREGLNMRQRKAIHSVRENGKMTKKQYCSLNAPCSEATARRDLDRLMAEEIFERHGKGRGTHYILS